MKFIYCLLVLPFLMNSCACEDYLMTETINIDFVNPNNYRILQNNEELTSNETTISSYRNDVIFEYLIDDSLVRTDIIKNITYSTNRCKNEEYLESFVYNNETYFNRNLTINL